VSNRELLRTRVDGTTSALPLMGPDPEFFRQLELSRDGAWAVYHRNTVDTRELWSVPVDASRPPLALATTSVYQSLQDDSEIRGDRARVVYRVEDVGFDGVHNKLMSAPISGAPAPIQLASGDIQSFVLTPDGRRAIYGVDSPPTEYSSVPVDGSAPAVS